MQAPPHGVLGVHGMVGVQVEPTPQGELLPTVHAVTGTDVAVAMHAPPQGTPLVQTMVGVQVDPDEQGALFPTVQVVAVAGGLMQRPPQGIPVVQT